MDVISFKGGFKLLVDVLFYSVILYEFYCEKVW